MEKWPTLKQYALEARGLNESDCNNKAVVADILQDILNVASCRQGNQNLQALVQTWPRLKKYHFTWKNIVKVASGKEGFSKLNDRLKEKDAFYGFIDAVVFDNEIFSDQVACSPTDTSTLEFPDFSRDELDAEAIMQHLNRVIPQKGNPTQHNVCSQTSALKQSGDLIDSAESKFFTHSKRKNRLVDSAKPSQELVTKRIRR